MPVSHRIDRGQKVIYTAFEGGIDDQQLLEHANRILPDPEIDESYVELVRAKTSSVRGLSPAGSQRIAEVLKGATGPGMIALVVSEEVEFGLARMISLMADESPIEMRVFRDEADARAWLGLPRGVA